MSTELTPDAALADPRATIAAAERGLARERDPVRRARLLWICGLARREVHDLVGATRDIDACLDQLARLPTPGPASVEDLRHDALIARALVRFLRGFTDDALELLTAVLAEVPAGRAARAEIQSALVLQRAGRLRDATLVGERALRDADRQQEPALIAAVRTNVGLLYGQQGRFDRAITLLDAAIAVADEHRLAVPAVIARHNRGYVAARAGRWHDALVELAEATDRYRQLADAAGTALARADRAAVLFELGLVDDAAGEIDDALAGIRIAAGPADVADVALLAARVRLACGDLDGGRSAAAEARDLYATQGRSAMLPLADQLMITADHRRGRAAPDALEAVALDLARHDWYPESAAAFVAAARGHARLGNARRAQQLVDEVDPRRGGAIVRLERSLVSAIAAETAGRKGAARRAVTLGLRTLTENLASFDALELQAHATERGAELTDIGVRLAHRDRRPGELVRRLETVRSLPFVATGAIDPASPVGGLLRELRSVSHRRRVALASGSSTEELAREQTELEQRIRYASLTARARTTRADPQRPTVPDGTVVIEYFEHDGELGAVTTDSGARWRLRELAGTADLQAEIDHLHFALDRLHRAGTSEARRARAAAAVQASGAQLERRLVRDVVGSINGGARVVIVPSPSLHGVPWGALPILSTRPTVVTPSLATLPIRGQGADGAARDAADAVVVVGPDLPGAERECAGVLAAYARANGPVRTVDEANRHLGHATVAHFACHGRLRHDNPAFSSLLLDDGELTMFDLQGIGRLPATIVLAACDAGHGLLSTGGALLGLATALVQLGVRSVIAPVTSVDDEWSVDFAVHLHGELARGTRPADALAATRRAHERFAVDGASFVCFGS